MAPPLPELMDELVEEILLRFPPDDPASLVRATLVCKLWCRFVCSTMFHRRFREFHCTAAPLLGLLYDHTEVIYDDPPRNPDGWVQLVDTFHWFPIAYFIPMTSFRPLHASNGRHGWHAVDARHGRVLLWDPSTAEHGDLCVWDPVTDEQQHLSEPPFSLQVAAVACAATAGGYCNHLDCSRGPFLVVIMGIQDDVMHLSVYSSEAGAWSKVTLCGGTTADSITMFNKLPGVLVRSALYTLVQCNHVNHEILKYDLATRQVSIIHLPPKFRRWKPNIMVMTDDDGNLGFVANVKYKLWLWSRVAGCEDAGFVLSRVIDLRKVVPSATLVKNKTCLNGFADGGASRVLFIRTIDGLYSIEVNSSRVSKITNPCGDGDVVPYISFCTPTSRLQHG